MQLYLHIGTNKTGSSFIQSTLICNQEVLLSSEVLLPSSQWDDAMRQGQITPGNGHALAKLLLSKDRQNISRYLVELKHQAEAANCNKVLLSNEILIRLFSDKTILTLFEQEAETAGFNAVNYLCYNRNLYEHALSLYKHRAKYGKHPDYRKWFEEDYETLIIFEKVIENIKLSKANWTFLSYEKDSSKIIGGFMKWLDSNPKINPFPKLVNVSLTLNQIKQITALLPKFEYKIGELYADFIKIGSNSQENPFLKQEFFTIAEQYFSKHQNTIDVLKTLTQYSSDLMQKPIISQAVFPDEYTAIEETKIIKRFKKEGPKETLKRFWFMLNKIKKRVSRAIGISKKNDMSSFGGSLR